MVYITVPQRSIFRCERFIEVPQSTNHKALSKPLCPVLAKTAMLLWGTGNEVTPLLVAFWSWQVGDTGMCLRSAFVGTQNASMTCERWLKAEAMPS